MAASLSAGRLLAATVSFVWIVVAARLLTVVQFADLALLLSLGLLAATVADFGLPLVLTDMVTVHPGMARPAFLAVVRRRLLLGLVASALVTMAYVVWAHDTSAAVPALFSVSVLATTVASSGSALLRARRAVGVEALNEVLSRVLVLGAGGLWLSGGGGLVGAVAVYALADACSAAFVSRAAWQRCPPSHGTLPLEELSLRRVAPLGITWVLAAVYYRVDVWLLAAVGTSRQLALYATAYRLFDGLLLPSNALSSLALPATSHVDRQLGWKRTKRLVRASIVLVAPVAAVAAVFAGPLMGNLFGARYQAGAPALRLLMAAAVPSAVILVVGPRHFVDSPRRSLVVVSACLAVNAAMNVVLIPALGPEGAAATTAVTQAGLAAALLWPHAEEVSAPPVPTRAQGPGQGHER